jgi:tetratricopeptide (TPR) repeat protein
MRGTSIIATLFSPALKIPAGLFFIFLLVFRDAAAQKNYLYDSLTKQLARVQTDKDKVSILCDLTEHYSGFDNELARQYAEQAIQVAELSRDRRLIIQADLNNGTLYINLAPLQSNIQQAEQSYETAEKTARESGLDDLLAYSYTGLAKVCMIKGDYDKSLNYNNLALSIVSGSSDDSLRIVVDISIGNAYQARNEKLLAFRSYLEALNIAELSRKGDLLRLTYLKMESFYVNIDEYDKAIDYAMKILAIDTKDHLRYNLLEDYNQLGKKFSLKKEVDLAMPMFERSIALADSLQYSTFKINVYLAITNMYFDAEGSVKGMAYLRSHREITDMFSSTGLGSFLDMSYGNIFADLHEYDSAYYFLKKSEPEIVQNGSPSAKCQLYKFFGDLYIDEGQYKNAIASYLKNREIARSIKDLNILEDCAKNLDTLYERTGDFKTAYLYNTEYNLYKDSIKSLANETDLLKLEVESDNRRRERQAKEEEENTLRRHNIQYMGLTAGLAGLFIVLAMLGMFVVHPGTIRAVTFFSFIFLFEFIILIADKQIHEWTHGEPWKILFIKIGLAAILLPLHHWLEHKAIHYLISRKKLAAPGRSLPWNAFRRKQAPPQEGV